MELVQYDGVSFKRIRCSLHSPYRLSWVAVTAPLQVFILPTPDPAGTVQSSGQWSSKWHCRYCRPSVLCVPVLPSAWEALGQIGGQPNAFCIRLVFEIKPCGSFTNISPRPSVFLRVKLNLVTGLSAQGLSADLCKPHFPGIGDEPQDAVLGWPGQQLAKGSAGMTSLHPMHLALQSGSLPRPPFPGLHPHWWGL